MSIDSASHDPSTGSGSILSKVERIELKRMAKYKTLAVAFSYPDENFFKFFPQSLPHKKDLIWLYDRLFRANEIWLYTTEYLAKNEFERSRYLADIMGFYRAFKVEPKNDRPDSLAAEFEFMHYLIFKRISAIQSKVKEAEEKAFICFDAEKKFFNEHLYQGAKKIAAKISSQTKNNFYTDIVKDMIDFMKSEKRYLGKN